MFSLLNLLYIFYLLFFIFSLILLFDILFIMYVPHLTLQTYLFYFMNSFVKQTVYICFVLMILKHTNIIYRQVFCNASSTNILSICNKIIIVSFYMSCLMYMFLIFLLSNLCKCRKYGESC